MMRLARRGFMRTVDVLTQAAYRASGGRVGARQAGRDILLLTTVGRKSGQERTHALLFVRDGERYVVCGSNFGDARHPAWYLNLSGASRRHGADRSAHHSHRRDGGDGRGARPPVAEAGGGMAWL